MGDSKIDRRIENKTYWNSGDTYDTYYTQLPLEFRTVHIPCNCRAHTSLFPTNCTVGFNAPTSFDCKMQQFSVSYKCWRYVQHATQVVKYKR
jgi:hypothetical protein